MLVSSADRILAYDIGGSHISVALCGLQPIDVLATAVALLPDTVSSSAFIDLLHGLGHSLLGKCQATGAALASPAPFSYAAGISQMHHKLAGLYGFNLRSAIAERFRWAPERVCFLNDADAALLGEATAGAAAKDAGKAAGIMLGTGIGFSFVQNGRLNDTAPGIPPDNEIWNLPFLDGIVEDRLSSRAIERDYQALTGSRLPVSAIVQQAGHNEAVAAVFDTFGRHLGQVVQQFIAPLEPEVVVFGGGISRSSHLFLPAAQNQIGRSAIRLVPSTLLEKAPFFGAVAYWRECSRQPAIRSTLL